MVGERRPKDMYHWTRRSDVLYHCSVQSQLTSFKGCITTIDLFAKQGDILLAILLIANRRGGIGKPLSDLSLCDTGIGETQGCDSQGNLNAQGGGVPAYMLFPHSLYNESPCSPSPNPSPSPKYSITSGPLYSAAKNLSSSSRGWRHPLDLKYLDSTDAVSCPSIPSA